MKAVKFLSPLVLIFLFACSGQKPQIDNMKVNNLDTPLALAGNSPHFSWQLAGQEDSVLQSAYRLQVFNGDEELWDSEKVEDGHALSIPYGGSTLFPGMALTWHVTVWDNHGNEITSPRASFETGLLSENRWQAKWIGKPASGLSEIKWKTSEPKWIWYPEPNYPDNNPKGEYYFKKDIYIEDLESVQDARAIFTGDDNNEVYFNSTSIGESGWIRMDDASIKNLLKEGRNTIEIVATNNIGSAGTLAQVYLEYKDGSMEHFSTGSDWLVSKDKERWVNAVAFASVGEEGLLSWCTPDLFRIKKILSPVYLRKEFDASKKVSKARLYATAKGVYEIHLNGKKVTDFYFAPGFTDYNKRFLYQAYDVTAHIQNGKNTIGAILGDGWYTGSIGWGDMRNHYGDYPLMLLAELHIEYTDGSREVIPTSESWSAAHGPIVLSDMLDGETHDARIDNEGWNRNGFEARQWVDVVAQKVTENVTADPGVPVQVMEVLSPVSVSEPKPGVYVLDMGQNMVGIVEGSFRGKTGDTITMRFAEMLKTDSMIYTENLRTADATNHYIFGEVEDVSWEPKFTFHGFRYVEITGLDYKPSPGDVKGKVLYSNIPQTGSISSSSKMLNQIVENVKWGQRGNFLNLPTDCPQRDERLGWMGDAQVFVKLAAYNMDVAAFFNKWLLDVRDAQGENGAFSSVAPRIVLPDDGSPAWGDAGVIVPWVLYQMYGDSSYLSQNYEAMKRWISYIYDSNPDYLWKNNRNNDFGDWLSTNAVTHKELIGTGFFAYSTKLVAKSAKELSKTDDYTYYTTLFDSIKTAFQTAYLSPEGKLTGDTQTAYVLALQFGLLEEEQRPVALKHLTDDIAARNNHHSTGFVGIGHLLPVLTENGYNDLAYTLILNETFPSLGYMVKNGATTIWERWDGYTEENGFQNPGMNSFNHYSLGSPAEWLYTHAAGIRQAAPGFKAINIKPHPGKALEFLNVDYDSPYGNIRSNWKLENDVLHMEVEIPANTTAQIYVPATGVEADISPSETHDNYSVYNVGSGKYAFKGTMAEQLYQ